LNNSITWLWGRLPLTRGMRAFIVWALSPKYTVGVVALVRDEQGQILVLKHTYRPDMPWGLPGGGLRVGESLEDCLHREVREEAGIEVEIGALLSAASHPNRKLVDMIFDCRPLPGETLDKFRPNAEISEARWASMDSLPKGMSKGQKRLLEIALPQADKAGGFHFQPNDGEWP